MDEKYLHRTIDPKISEYLQIFGALSIEGPKWCGKTSTMKHHTLSHSNLMDASTRTLAEADPKSVLLGANPHGIDEWQEIPAIWDIVRNDVDERHEKGLYILTGSVKPWKKKEIKHSGVGRIARMHMRPMTLFESNDSTGKTKLRDLMDGIAPVPHKSDMEIHDLIEVACRGGFPESLALTGNARYVLPKEYLDTTIESEIPRTDSVIKDKRKFRLLLTALSRGNASIIKNSTLHNDVQSAAGEFSTATLSSYLNIMRDLYLLEEIPGWAPQIRSKTRLLSSPKRMLVDPSLVVAALGTTSEKLYKDFQAFGTIFEGLCLRDLLVYADAIDAEVYHYRDNSNLEVDAIVEKRDGTWGAFEIKLGGRGIDQGAKSLLQLRDKMDRQGHSVPVTLTIITGSGICMTRPDGVNVVPISTLTA